MEPSTYERQEPMSSRIQFFLSRMRRHLWIKPLAICLLSITAVFAAKVADRVQPLRVAPTITSNSLETLLGIVAASMLGIAVFTVGAMLSAYQSASSSATPRTFALVIADDVSQNALSVFIGAFIFSIVSLVALMNGYYGKGGRFVLFLITAVVFAIVILSFIRWIDRIARLGRLGTTIDKVERVTQEALLRRKRTPTLGARRARGRVDGLPVYAMCVGYVQRVDVPHLQAVAEAADLEITVASLPGTFVGPDQPLAYVSRPSRDPEETVDAARIADAFVIAKTRAFADDPRFGLIVLSEIASRALSPAVNDPGTAIEVLDSMVRLFSAWCGTEGETDPGNVAYDRVAVPALSLGAMFDDAFNAIARDGAGTLEVAVRLQKAFNALGTLEDPAIQTAAATHARLAFRYAEDALTLPEEIRRLEHTAKA